MHRAGDLNTDDASATEETPAAFDASRNRWFLTIWPLAVLFHLAGNDSWLLSFSEPVGWFQLPLLVSATVLLVTRSTAWSLAVATSHLVVVVVKLPLVGNHEVFLGLVHLAVIGAIVTRRGAWLEIIVPVLRWVFFIGYGAIAISKLNHAFLDPAVSCAAVFGDEFARWFGLVVSDSPLLTSMAIWTTLVVELAIPVLLSLRISRRHGLVLGLVFHTVLAFEPFGHVFDFTSVLYVLFFCFLSSDAARDVTAGIEGLRQRMGTGWIIGLVVAMALGNVATNELLARGFPTPTWLFDYPLFMVYAGLVLQFVPSMVFAYASEPLRLRVPPVHILVLGVALANAFAPYAQIRTSGAFNMYSNLAVAEQSSNHLFLEALPFGRDQHLYRVVSVDADSELDFYMEHRLLIPENNLRHYANENPWDTSQVVLSDSSTGAETVALRSFQGDSNLLQRFLHRLLLSRAVQIDEPEACLRSWGPAN